MSLFILYFRAFHLCHLIRSILSRGLGIEIFMLVHIAILQVGQCADRRECGTIVDLRDIRRHPDNRFHWPCTISEFLSMFPIDDVGGSLGEVPVDLKQ